MKRLLLIIIALFSISANAIELKLTQNIPEKYALFSGVVKNNSDIDEKTIKDDFTKKCKDEDVEQCQLTLYQDGTKNGDGIKATMEISKDKNRDVSDFFIIPDDQIATLGKYCEIGIGYSAKVETIYKMYEDNEVVADEDLKDKYIIFQEVKIKDVSKDAFGKPYIRVGVDKHGLKNISFQIDTKDPFLRKIKKGSVVSIKAKAKGFVVGQVIMEGYIIYFADKKKDYFLLDGKALSSEEISSK